MKEVVYQECLYEEMTGEKPTKEKCGFDCHEEICKYCIETTIENDELTDTLTQKG